MKSIQEKFGQFGLNVFEKVKNKKLNKLKTYEEKEVMLLNEIESMISR